MMIEKFDLSMNVMKLPMNSMTPILIRIGGVLWNSRDKQNFDKLLIALTFKLTRNH